MPEAPLPGYTPAFVTQTDESPPWDDCLWASGAMLLDKWTHGDIRVDRKRLRRASGDLSAGSTFADFARGVSRLYGWRPQWSPSGGDPMTWTDLLERLADGGGAIIAGDYGDLGNPYTRWSRSYAANPRAAGHAMYVERYDADNNRLWLMDPLGRGGYRGEWVHVSRIRDFTWKRGRFVHAIATPAVPSSSVAGYRPAQLTLAAGAHRAGETVAVSLSFVDEGPWPLPDLQLATSWELVTPDGWTPPALPSEPKQRARADQPAEQVRTPLAAPVAPAPADDLPPTADPSAVAPADGGTLASQVPLPTAPGLWRLNSAIERAGGSSLGAAWQQAPIELRVWGDRGAVILPFATTAQVVATEALPLTVMIENAGRVSWPDEGLDDRFGELEADAATELHVSWRRADGLESPALGPLELRVATGDQLSLSLNLVAPRAAGTYDLRFDVRDDRGSLLAPELVEVSLSVLVGGAPIPTIGPPAR